MYEHQLDLGPEKKKEKATKDIIEIIDKIWIWAV